MQPEEQDYLNQSMNSNIQNTQIDAMQRNNYIQDNQISMLENQLSLREEIEMIENLLRSRVIGSDDQGNETWVDPEDSSEVLLSEYGVNLIMKRIKMYMNKNTLLSNYSEDIIMNKMADISNSLNDEIFMKYELVFKFPTSEEIQRALSNKIDHQVKNMVFNSNFSGRVADEKKVRDNLIAQLNIDYELQKMKEILFKDKLKSFEGLTRSVQDCIHSAYLRALNGGERRSLRKTMSVSEVISPPMQGRRTGGGFLGLLKR
jgi:hypothetical protein